MAAVSYIGPDGEARCRWCGAAPEYLAYHDSEWGFPLADDNRLFETLCLESFQSGLSWRTILSKRENFRRAFQGFDIDRVSRFAEADVARLLQDSGIVRHRGKIEAAINNADRALAIAAEAGSLAGFFWRYEPAESGADAASQASAGLSKALKKRGWKFVGPTTVYAFMQAAGLINDHAAHCVTRAAVERAREAFQRPR